MKDRRLRLALVVLGLLATVATSAAWPERGDRGFNGGAYLTTISANDPQGAFASRSVITLHADRTMSAVDSGQQGPTSFFSSQAGSWKPSGHGIVGRTIDFSFLPGIPGIARADYTMTFPTPGRVEGTITITLFPLKDGNPIDGEGTLLGTFTFEGMLIRP